MALKVHTAGPVGVVAIAGRFDAHVAPMVRAALDDCSGALIVVSLAEVHFVDSTALATLVSGMKRCRQLGGDLRLCSLQQPVRIIFELTRMDKAFQMYAGEAEAIRSFGS